MPSLERTLRRQLENTVKAARRVAEAGACKALEQLAVERHEPHSSMTPQQRELRNRLRAHGRQLGDVRDKDRGHQAIGRLTQECAYEHWHRMLFARFLAENELLIEPESGVAISLGECVELAREQGVDWLPMASDFAQRMLPQIFRSDDPVLELPLPLETRSELEDLLKKLPTGIFLADDSLGWVYQFWQAEEKDKVNKSEKKIGADELPAVTQLFTEDYMVEFLLHNTLGAWWAGKKLATVSAELQGNWKTELDARKEMTLPAIGNLPAYEWTYLRFINNAETDSSTSDLSSPVLPVSPVVNSRSPAAGTFPLWPKTVAALRVLDPCCGSGHFLVFALPILARMRMLEEGLSARDACDAVLRENLFGLELDHRCTQIAAFNLALAAWKFAGYRSLPRVQVACSGLSVGASKESWLKLAKGSPKLEAGLARLYETFQQAPTLGSLIDPRAGDIYGLFEATFDEVRPLLDQALFASGKDDDAHEVGVAAQGLMEAVRLLTNEYTLVITNVPYLARGKQDPKLRDYAEQYYADAKQDLATVFMRRCLDFTDSGTVAVVTPQNWLFLSSYKKMRELLLKEQLFNVIGRLGTGAFETISGEVVNVALCVLSNLAPDNAHAFMGVDASEGKGAAEKAEALYSNLVYTTSQATCLTSADYVVSIRQMRSSPLLNELSGSYQGLCTSDDAQFVYNFWEVAALSLEWRWIQSASEAATYVGGASRVLFWEDGQGRYFRHAMALKEVGRLGGWKSGKQAWNKAGIAINVTRNLYASAYLGTFFDNTIAAVTPTESTNLSAMFSYITSPDYLEELRHLDQSLSVTEHTLIKVPFDLAHWQKVAAEKYPHGLPEPYSDDPTQWIFHGHPCGSVQWNEDSKKLEIASTLRTDANVLQVSVARMLGYKWPAEHDADMRLSKESRSLVARCAELESFADMDGIICLNPMHGEAPAEQRLLELLAAAYGAEWSAAKLEELLGNMGTKSATLDDWLRDNFFEQHCALFHQRPFVWHIWDGQRNGFHALVNYHKLAAPGGEGKQCLDKLRYTYLGDWISRQRQDQAKGVEGADARLAAALHLKEELDKIAEGVVGGVGKPSYDIFVRWKALHDQAIGWEPDINDGVRMNIRPFMTAKPLNAKAKNACILRSTPKGIKWDKDRGKEPQRDKDDFPWFWGWDEKAQDFPGGKTFDGMRWNDLHYSNELKKKAREKKGGGM